MKNIFFLKLIICLSFFMTFGQESTRTLIIDETEKVEKSEVLPVSEISDALNRSAIEKALSETRKILKFGSDCVKKAKIYNSAEVNGVEMFEGLKGQHIRRITIDYKIYLYSLCDYQGILAVNHSKILWNYAYRSEDDVSLKILDDINQNGNKEILIRSEKIDRRGYFRKTRIVEISETGIDEIFYRQTFENRVDVPVTELKTIAEKIYVKKSKSPIFYKEQFEKSENDWKAVGTITKIENLPGKIVDYIEITKAGH